MSAQPEWRVPIGDEQERVAGDPIAPAEDAHDKVEQTPGVGSREENRKPGDDDGDHGSDPQEEENDVVRDSEKPLDQGQPAVQLASIRVREGEVDGLLLVGRWIPIVEQGQVGRYAV